MNLKMRQTVINSISVERLAEPTITSNVHISYISNIVISYNVLSRDHSPLALILAPYI